MTFPSLVIRAEGFEPQGAFAQAQAMYLEPDPTTVKELASLLERTGAGIVAHFYMDAELQGVLAAVGGPFVHVADSLQMADRAVAMAERGARAIVVLGVDFMSENVRALLDASGFAHVPVYRVSPNAIGCSLAESAEALAYGAYLEKAARTPHSLHVIYVNTSLRVKARGQALLPTITCTSSNVVKLLLQAFAQVPDLTLWFGPDTYMGRNLTSMFQVFASLDAETVRRLHPRHTPESIAAAAARLHYFEQGVCIVHHMFGDAVVAEVKRDYPDALVTAHLEVPGEMFALGFAAEREGRGVVGSTSNILSFIGSKVDEAVAAGKPARLQFVLGTEAGMTTPIARAVRAKLASARAAGGPDVSAEVVFPVASEAVATTADAALPIVPGVASAEGCSTAGGCATCPYMKQNSLDALLDVLQLCERGETARLLPYAPKVYAGKQDGKSVAELGGRSIVYMRAFQKTGELPAELCAALS